MSPQLDYEATKAALRAQLSAQPARGRPFAMAAWKWYGVATSVVVVACAVLLTVWVTTGSRSSFNLVQSGERAGATVSARDAAQTTTDPTPIPGAPTLLGETAVIQPDGSITGFDTAGNVIVIASPTPEQTAAVRQILSSPRRSASNSTRVPAPIVVPAPRTRTPRPTDPPTGGGTPTPTTPPAPPVTNPPVTPEPTQEPPPPPPPATVDPPPVVPPSTPVDPAPVDNPGPTTDNSVNVVGTDAP